MADDGEVSDIARDIMPGIRMSRNLALAPTAGYDWDMPLPTLKRQEIPFDHPDSNNMFQPSAEKPFVATPAAIDMYQQETIFQCLQVLQSLATERQGIDYLQVFEDPSKPEALWLIEDGPGGAVTALVPSDY